ncbi:MAG: thiol peroxidase [Akkermansiaceae bacterium]|nr:thiol peroxidase [Armatimonadota bacterium]
MIENDTEHVGVVTFKGAPMTLVGPALVVGDAAPEETLTGQGLIPVMPLADSEGKARLFVVVPSVDTSVCSLESKRFSDELKAFPVGAPVAVYVVSADLPFAQKRWCGAEGVNNLTMLSDYKSLAWGAAWGVILKELHLLARAVFVVGKDGRITYKEIVGEVASEPDYAKAMNALKLAAD